ncbi:MAG: hypothetical protein KatS3mg115_2275 [Candidatus Poribacteria bacterium]|nr:MAG: hypothetical protein KatS3mg115_2275 [Candidatus Poribacteria bacterium]
MDYEILYRPTYSLLRVLLSRDESIQAETGAMVSMSEGIQLSTQMRGGLLGAVKRALGGESLFLNTFTAERTGEVTFSPALPGDIAAIALENESWLAQSGAFLAATEGVEVDAKWGGARSFFSGEGLIMLRLSGTWNRLPVQLWRHPSAGAGNWSQAHRGYWSLGCLLRASELPGSGRSEGSNPPFWEAKGWSASWKGRERC